MRTEQRILRAIVLFCLLASCLGAASAVVTAANLLEHEQLWPYRVTLAEAWQPPGGAAVLAAGTVGVLIRIETGGVARIDFASDGKYEIPIEKTDLVEAPIGSSAERSRNGRRTSSTRSARTSSILQPIRSLRCVPRRSTIGAPTCVYSRIRGQKEFAEMVTALRPLKAHVETIFFPQGEQPDAATRDQLRAADWKVPFVYGFLSEPYTRTLVRDGTSLPAVMLVSNEGRLLFGERGRPPPRSGCKLRSTPGSKGR
jgi:hypothetical protein